MDVISITSRVGLYARVSTDEQREGQTIESQLAELERYAQQQGWHVCQVYRDEGWSGAVLARPALDALRDDAAAGLFNAVLVNDVDRLARDVSHLGIVKRDLERRGVRLIFRKLPGDNNPTYNLLVNVLGSFAEFEKELITDRTRRGRRYKVEVRKQFIGTNTPYGFQYRPKDPVAAPDGELLLEPMEAAVVSSMYAWVDEDGLSGRQVGTRLNQQGIRPRKGRVWGTSSVMRILRSETYAGVWHYNKYQGCPAQRPTNTSKYRRNLNTSTRLRPRKDWIPLVLAQELRIVPRARWERVQTQLDRNRVYSPRNGKHSYLLSGLVRCGACRRTYVGEPCHGKFYYRCHARCRKLPTIKAEYLDGVVWNAVEEAVLNPALITEQTALLEERYPEKTGNVERESARLVKSLNQVRVEEEGQLVAYRAGGVSPTELASRLSALNRRRLALETQQRTLFNDSQSESPLVTATVVDYCRVAAERLKTLSVQERQRFLRLLLQEVVFEGAQVRIRGIIPAAPDAGDYILQSTSVAPEQSTSEGLRPRGQDVVDAIQQGTSAGLRPDHQGVVDAIRPAATDGLRPDQQDAMDAIPQANRKRGGSPSVQHGRNSPDAGVIAAESAKVHGRNTPAEDAVIRADTRRMEVPFELTRPVQSARLRRLSTTEAA